MSSIEYTIPFDSGEIRVRDGTIISDICRPIALKEREAIVLRLLHEARGKTVPHQALIDALNAEPSDNAPATRATHDVQKLRGKLGSASGLKVGIVSVYSKGYRLSSNITLTGE